MSARLAVTFLPLLVLVLALALALAFVALPFSLPARARTGANRARGRQVNKIAIALGSRSINNRARAQHAGGRAFGRSVGLSVAEAEI